MAFPDSFGAHRSGAFLAAAAALVLLACGCVPPATDDSAGEASERPVDGNATVKVGLASLPQQKDPLNETVGEVYFLAFNLVYDRLLTIDHQGELKPMLATEWEYAKDGRAVTLTLREDAKFDDGTPLDAEVVVANLQRVSNSGSIAAEPLAAVTKVHASGPYEVRIEMSEPTTQVVEGLAMNAGMILHPDLLEDDKAAEEFNGSGAYEVKEFLPGAKVVLTRKESADDYWDSKAAQVKAFEVQVMTDPKALANGLKSGQFQLGQVTSPDSVDALQGDVDSGKLGLQDSIAVSWLTLSMNRAVEPLDDIEVRRAVNEAIDRDVLIDAFFPGSEPAVQWAREDSPYFDDEVSYNHDADAARKRLANAGYPEGVDLGTIEVSNTISKNAVEAVQGMLAEAGIEVDLRTVDASQVFANFAGGKVTASINWAAGLGMRASVNKLASNFGPSRIQPAPDDEAVQLLAKADDNLLSDKERDAIFTDLNRHLTEEAWTAPLLWINFRYAYDANLTGLEGGEFDYATVVGPYDWRYFAMHKR